MAKVKRKRIDWVALRREIGDLELDCYYYELLYSSTFVPGSLTRRKKGLSENRASYYSLRHWYGDKTLDIYRKTGDWSFALSMSFVHV